MSELKNLVPPLELCKLIPVGEFEDSAHWYRWSYIDQKYLLDGGKPDVRLYREPCPCGMKYFYPAPTLEEIMAELPSTTVCGKEHHSDWYVSHWKIGCVEDTDREGAAVAALKVWLKMKRIEA